MADDTPPFGDDVESPSEDQQIEDMIATADGPEFSDFSAAELEGIRTNYLIQIFIGGCLMVIAFLLPGSPIYLGLLKWVLGILGVGISLVRIMQVNGVHQELVNREETSTAELEAWGEEGE